MTKEYARQILQEHIEWYVKTHGCFTMPTREKIIKSEMRDNTLLEYTFVGLFKIAYGLK